VSGKIASLIRILEARFPGNPVFVEPFSGEDDPDISWQIWVTNVEPGRLRATEDIAIDAALDLYGDDPIPFLVNVASVEKTERCLAHLKSHASIEPGAFIAYAAGALLAQLFYSGARDDLLGHTMTLPGGWLPKYDQYSSAGAYLGSTLASYIDGSAEAAERSVLLYSASGEPLSYRGNIASNTVTGSPLGRYSEQLSWFALDSTPDLTGGRKDGAVSKEREGSNEATVVSELPEYRIAA